MTIYTTCNPKPRPWVVYGLTDELGVIRYIGITQNPRDRLYHHLKAKRQVRAWAESLPVAPGWWQLDTFATRAEAEAAEGRRIACAGRIGHALINRAKVSTAPGTLQKRARRAFLRSVH